MPFILDDLATIWRQVSSPSEWDEQGPKQSQDCRVLYVEETIGLSIVRLIKVEDGLIHIEDVDIVDGTPLLDIKPLIPDFDASGEDRTGSYRRAGERVSKMRSDHRFK